MDSSQNSDIFSDNTINEDHPLLKCNNQSYHNLITKTKKFLSSKNSIEDPEFIVKFSSCLEDCNICISRCLETITCMLKDCKASLDTLFNSLEDASSLLQLITCFFNNVIDSIVLSCSDLKTFPITTASIILTIFTHCKESACLYGKHLNSVETHLKDLFQACQQLLLIYLKILEKYFIFDFEDKDQQNVLIKALNINLRICDIVQVLDVKTMAEQWKAFTAICEKYTSKLVDENIYNQCSKLLCNVIEINLKMAIEKDEQDKIFLRSIKVASFCIKILLKVSNIFKCGTTNNYENVVHLLIFIYVCDAPVLEAMLNKSQQYISQMNLLIVNTSHSLICQLLLDERFLKNLLQFYIKKVNDEKQLGYILLLISIIKCSVQMSADISPTSNSIIINCFFNVIPYCDHWFHSGLMFKNKDNELSGLEEHLLAHAVALCASLDSDEFATFECRLYENILSTNVFIGMFTSQLWLLVARMSGPSYTFSLLIMLCKVYQKVENDDLFNDSSQKVYLGNVMNKLYEDLSPDNKVKLKNQFEIEESNYSLWNVLKIKNLPLNTCLSMQEYLIENLLINLNKIQNNQYQKQDMQKLISTIKVLSTCSFEEVSTDLEKTVMMIWIKACPKFLFSFPKEIDPGIYWYYLLLESLIPLTNETIELFCLENVVKIFKIMSNIVLTGNNDLQLLLIPSYCKISFYLNVAENDFSIDAAMHEGFKYILSETDLIKRYSLNELVKYSNERKFKSIVLKIITESVELEKLWQEIVKVNQYNIDGENELTVSLADCNYIHKCVNSKNEMEDALTRTKSQSNFEIDIDNLFDGDSTSEEPVSKKAKLDESETEIIIKRLEEDSVLLHKVHDISDKNMKRIIVVYNRLRSIVE